MNFNPNLKPGNIFLNDEKNIIYYTGMGTTGDQTLGTQNKTVAESNTVALCPNYYRKMHILNSDEDKKTLLKKTQ